MHLVTPPASGVPRRRSAQSGEFGAHDAGALEFTSAFENAPIGMALVDADSRRLRVNKAFCRMLGYTEDELLARTLQHITHPDDVEADLCERSLCLAGEKDTYQHEKRYLHRDGRVVWADLTCTLVRDARGQPLHFISQVLDITGRKDAEQALRRSEARFRSLTLLSSDWFWEQDDRFRYTDITGLPGEDQSGRWRPDPVLAIGLCRWELPNLYPLKTSWAEHRAMLQAHQPFEEFEYMRAVDGEPARYLSCSGEPVFDDNGRFTGYRGTARDITEHKLAEQRLRDTQALLHMAAQIGRLGAWEFEVGKPCAIWSGEVCAIHEVRQGFQPTPEQALGFVAPEHRDAMRGVLAACLADGSPFDVEAQIITAKGRRLWVRVIGEAEWDAKGRVRRLQGACQDISESKHTAEHARVMAEQLTSTLESLTDAFFTVDRNWRFTYLNGKAERMLGRSRQELLGKLSSAEVPHLLDTVFAGELRKAMEQNVVIQCEEHYAPANVWIQVKAFPSRQGLAVYVKNVTARVLAQREILRLNGELEERVAQRTAQLAEANKELEAFSYSIAHDLRAPLSSIDGFSQMLGQSAGTELTGPSRHYLSRIRSGVRQMGELTDGLLALANLSRTSLRCETVDLAALARTAIAACREHSPGREVQVSITTPLPARGDPRLLAQVIGNLLGNAWKFTARTTDARIEVGWVQGQASDPIYFVRDNGAGFEMAYAAKMFEAFHRMHSTADFEGTGIGLAIVHKVVTRHGGRIWAEAAPDQGASFYFTLGAGPA